MEWFKFRMCWRRPLLRMSDEEAGKVIKAILNYLESEEEQETGGDGDILLCQVTEVLQEDVRQFKLKAARKEAIRKKRSEAGRKSGEARRAKSGMILHDEQVFTDVLPTEQEFECVHVCSGLLDKNKNTEIRYSEKEKEEDTEAESETDWGSSSGLPPAATELPAIRIPLVNGTEHPIFRKDIDEYTGLYPDVNIDQELRNMRGWCLANPTRRKTKRGVKAFINSWLKKAQQEANMKPDVPENPFLAYARGEKEIGEYLL